MAQNRFFFRRQRLIVANENKKKSNFPRRPYIIFLFPTFLTVTHVRVFYYYFFFLTFFFFIYVVARTYRTLCSYIVLGFNLIIVGRRVARSLDYCRVDIAQRI